MYQKAIRNGFLDVVFMNEKKEITEGAISNIFVLKDQVYLTPPVTCGLLNGIYRQHLLKTLPNIREQVLYIKDLLEADTIFISNVVKGLKEVELNPAIYEIATNDY